MAIADRDHYPYWWQALIALPASNSETEVAYERLARIFRDQTRSTSPDPQTGRRGQEFTNPASETHLTVVLWENFAVFRPGVWIPHLWAAAQLKTPIGSVRDCRWSYQ